MRCMPAAALSIVPMQQRRSVPHRRSPTVDLATLALALLLPAMLLLNPAQTITFAALALKRPAPPGPPARLIFVRFND